ncbi:H(+)-transporting two-sector ATPase [Candidatus Promineifilum breve]|uniref:H(+)-transporting two-sector ATPase n=1 Tax=Candidatus Promineifilum breve TaxID=1806508 RepID=A0A160SYR8_9CHLR|nr:potassium transporter TrkG [Candidatus Promineifilum breve]CUS02476.1 H(+)-transporting two-sector ATPase [Candidatus Promineifilum breve]
MAERDGQPPDRSAISRPRRPIPRVVTQSQRPPRLSQAERSLGLIAGLGLIVLVGTFFLWLPISAANEPLALNEAFFTAVSAVATTGLSIITPGLDLSIFGQIVLMVLMQLGGLGFMIAAVTVFRLVGKPVTFAERLTLRDSLGLISSGQILKLSTLILIAVVVIELIGAFVLWLAWWPIYGVGPAAYYAVFHSVSAFTNASFDLFSGSPTAAAGFPTDTVTLLTLSALIFLGGIGIPVISDLLRYRRTRRLSLHTRITLTTAAVLIVAGTLLFFLMEYRYRNVFASESVPRLLLLSFFHSVASRTSGFVVSANFSQLEPGNGFLLMILMFIGASPASTGGGITTSTFAILVLALWNFARGRSAIVVGRRALPMELLFKATAILTAASAAIIVVTWLLLYTQENVTLIAALIEAISAFATCGFSLGLTPRLDLFGQLLIAGLMFFGRVGTLTIIVALARPLVPAAVTVPEERILLG